MYRYRVLELADFMEKLPPEKLEMDKYAVVDGEETSFAATAAKCGTSGCIAGWTVMYFKEGALEEVLRNTGKYTRVDAAARLILGLDEFKASYLFSGKWHPEYDRVYNNDSLSLDFTPQMCANELRRIACE